MDPFSAWIEGTRISTVMRDTTWLWPACESIHFIGLALIIGIAGFFDLRLMGFFKQVPIDDARELMPLAVIGFLLNLTTGVTFFIGHPEQYAHNPAWWWKIGFLLLAGINAFAFQFVVGKRTVGLRAGADAPIAARTIGVVSLISWFAVLYFGRMLPFLGGAF